MKKSILLIDDDKTFLNDLKLFLSDNYSCSCAHSISDGQELFQKNQYELIILDIDFGGHKNGLDLLGEIRFKNKTIPVIMVTRHDDIDIIVKAMKKGANDYLKKPLKLKEFMLHLDKVFLEANLKRENISLKKQLENKEIPFFGNSPQIQKIKQIIKQVAILDTPVLITGETGVGKEIAARMIHKTSKRKKKPFLLINCSAIPENLVESELFGHEAGAFTGALKRHIGKFEQADGCTLLLDEIGDLNLGIQTKLLNVLESQEFYRLGGKVIIHTNIRFLFATNKNLQKAVKDGEFREDLYYRINIVPLQIPPLRERPQDFSPIIDFYLDVYARLSGREKLLLTPQAVDYLKSLSWPGNIRELKNALERASVFCSSDIIDSSDLQFLSDYQTSTPNQINTSLKYETAKQHTLERFQREYIENHLQRSNGNITEAAQQMGLNRSSLQRMIKELAIKKYQ